MKTVNEVQTLLAEKREQRLTKKVQREKPQAAAERVRQSVPGVGDIYTRYIQTAVPVRQCKSGCSELASEMNKWGPDVCESKADHIVDRTISNSKLSEDEWKNELNAVQSLVVSLTGKAPGNIIHKTYLRWAVHQACADVRKAQTLAELQLARLKGENDAVSP